MKMLKSSVYYFKDKTLDLISALCWAERKDRPMGISPEEI